MWQDRQDKSGRPGEGQVTAESQRVAKELGLLTLKVSNQRQGMWIGCVSWMPIVIAR